MIYSARSGTTHSVLTVGVLVLAYVFRAAPVNGSETDEAPAGLTFSGATTAQFSASGTQDGGSDSSAEAPTAAQVRLRTWAILAGGAAGLAAYGMNNWWQDGFTGTLRTHHEGWFGQDTNDGGADKLGHTYATYVGTRLLARSLEWAGNDKDKALALAGIATFGAFTAVEIADGFTTKWKFSYEDVIMNAAGIGLAIAMEKHPDLDRLVDFRLLYQPSDEPRNNYFDPFGDYSGQTYLLVFKASGIDSLRHHPLLRYVELAVGYGTRGYGAPPDVGGDPSRNIYAGISINLSELLGQTVFAGAGGRSKTQRVVDGFLEFVQIPGTVALTHRQL
jgi:hypothetical protein